MDNGTADVRTQWKAVGELTHLDDGMDTSVYSFVARRCHRWQAVPSLGLNSLSKISTTCSQLHRIFDWASFLLGKVGLSSYLAGSTSQVRRQGLKTRWLGRSHRVWFSRFLSYPYMLFVGGGRLSDSVQRSNRWFTGSNSDGWMLASLAFDNSLRNAQVRTTRHVIEDSPLSDRPHERSNRDANEDSLEEILRRKSG